MLQTIIAKYHDGASENVLGIVVETDDDELDVIAAIKAAAAEFAATPEGEAAVEAANGDLNYGDFVQNVPNTTCENHGFTVVDTFQTNLVVDHNERLIPY